MLRDELAGRFEAEDAMVPLVLLLLAELTVRAVQSVPPAEQTVALVEPGYRSVRNGVTPP